MYIPDNAENIMRKWEQKDRYRDFIHYSFLHDPDLSFAAQYMLEAIL